MKKVFIVILNYKGHEDTFELLKSLKNLKKEKFDLHVIIVDNYPPDRIKLDESDYEDIKLKMIYNEKNLGFAGGNNVGINYSMKNHADYIVILNNDTLVDENFIEELIKVAEKDQKVGVVVPKIYFVKGFEFHKDKYKENELGKVIWYGGGNIDWANVIGYHRGVDEVDNGQFDEIVETEIASGCCLFVKKEVFEKVGLYDEKYFLYYEDADLSIRIKKAGYRLMFAPKSRIWHKNAQSTGGSGSLLQDYFITRNRMYFGFKYSPIRSRIALVKESLRFLAKGRPAQRKGIVDFYLKRMNKGSFNLGK